MNYWQMLLLGVWGGVGLLVVVVILLSTIAGHLGAIRAASRAEQNDAAWRRYYAETGRQ